MSDSVPARRAILVCMRCNEANKRVPYVSEHASIEDAQAYWKFLRTSAILKSEPSAYIAEISTKSGFSGVDCVVEKFYSLTAKLDEIEAANADLKSQLAALLAR